MSVKFFVDTNVLIYAFDIDAGVKHEIAKDVLQGLWEQKSGTLSMQVLQEFYNKVTCKLATPLPREFARRAVQHYSQWCIATGSPEIVRAFSIEDRTQVSFWDALIIAAAEKAGAAHILTEDLNHGQLIEGIRIENPFKSHAYIAPLGII
jgi:predicted nucleic acid-binding protein